jgi:hypothetical protein
MQVWETNDGVEIYTRTDAYRKLYHILGDINNFSSNLWKVQTLEGILIIDLILENVCFATAIIGQSFTLLSFTNLARTCV